MFRRSVHGIALTPSAWEMTHLKKEAVFTSSESTLEGAPLSGLMSDSPFDANELQILKERLTTSLKAKGKTRVGLSLPDASGHILSLPRPQEAKTPQEVEEMVRWSLRDRLPLPRQQLRLSVSDTRKPQLLVSALHEAKAQQLEELFDSLGHPLLHLSFHSLNLWTYLQTRQFDNSTYLLLCQAPGSLQWFKVEDGVVRAYRQKKTNLAPEQIEVETRRTLTVWRRKEIDTASSTVYVALKDHLSSQFKSAMSALFGQPRFIALNPSGDTQAYRMAALTAAEAVRRMG